MAGQVDNALNGKKGLGFSVGSFADQAGIHLSKIPQGTKEYILSETGMKGLITTALGSINEEFEVTQEFGIGSMESIQESSDEAVDEIGKHIEDYKEKMKKAVKETGDGLGTFADDSVAAAKEATDTLAESAETFKTNLSELNTEIGKGAAAITSWKKEMGTAISSASKLIKKSTGLLKKLGEIEIKAGTAADATNKYNEAISDTGTEVPQMASSISEADIALKEAAEAAAEAYKQMTEASNTTNEVAEDNMDSLGSVAEGVADTVGSLYGDLGEVVGEQTEGMIENTSDLTQAVEDADSSARSVFEDLWEFFQEMAKNIIGEIGKIFNATSQSRFIDTNNGNPYL